jgi:hypothetical protein
MPRFSIKALFFVTTFVAAAIAVLTGGEAAVAQGLAIIAMLLVTMIAFAMKAYDARDKREREADEQNPTT